MRDKRIKSCDKEPDGWCIVTEYGWAFEASDDLGTASHVRIFETKKEARPYLTMIEPCTCLRCTSRGREA